MGLPDAGRRDSGSRDEGLRPGIHVPLVTPFAADGGLAVGALERLAHEVLDAGAAGLVALGTTAEAATLDAGERRAVAEAVRGVCRARGAAFTVGVSGNDPRRVAAELAAVGDADAALVTVPYFTRPSEAGVLAYFERLAAAGVPLLVYNIPYRTGRPLGLETLRAIAALPGVLGFKQAVGGVDQVTVAALGAGVPLFAGDDVFAPALLALGARGGVLAAAHLATDRWVRLAASYEPGPGHELARLAATLFAEPNPAVIKGVLHAQGRIPTPDVRLPLLAAARPSVETALRAIGSIGDTRDRTYAVIGETG